MSFGIADLSIIPMRREQSERSEMVSQILFGELYEVLEIGEKWVYVRLLHDGYEGWIDRKMLLPVTEEYAVRYQMERQQLATGTFHIVQKKGDWGNQLIVPGSVFPFWDAETKTMQVGDRHYLLVSKQRELAGGNVRDLLISAALMYYNAPYLWGGRSLYGIDCSGLAQMAYRLAGIDMPRDASQQAVLGELLFFLEEALPGDLAFFGDDAGAITHVGILWGHGRIIHASGRVRVDRIDHQGIFNEELKRYTHNLKLIKRIIQGNS